ncbi:microtubule associated protein-domain-containing protein [Lasiosphaeris hirsuta]|uniref:Microtubule associated protein-domain-containing protein n=1 Tax=Lasiosphaeris hirsuta TaxID=260670 RepID=A0AA40A8R7_9PEZI|nr:microtubule associated protein-domain-containing protein [Lasiosphaeris hirsuta]
MDTSYLAQQVNTIIDQLHGLFDEIGVPNHDREARESELFVALSDALHNQVRIVTAEKKEMIEEAQKIVTTIRQMEASLDDSKPRRDYKSEDDDLKITYPLTRCLQILKEKHSQISRLHKERFEQIKKLVQALESYSLHLEPTFVKIALPPTGPNQSIPPSFDLSPSYVDKLDGEFTRVYEEYTRRVATVRALAENTIQLWAELGTPQAQTDGAIVKYYRDAPEQLGLHEEDVARLRSKRDKLLEEKKSRERRLRDLKVAVEALWEKLGVDERERKAFLNSNRGCGVRQINEFEDELERLNDLKRQNFHLFVEDARFKLQELWDALYLSEDEMLEFTPAFSDVYSDALLEAHEREVARLEVLKEQRAPTLALVDRYKTLVHDRDELAASSQDASRLMMRGQKGEKRDPGKLLREEKMRKRISKELPKVAADLRKGLEKWEDEYGRPFLVHGERFLDVIESDEPRAAPGPRSKTPAPMPTVAKSAKPATLSRANSAGNLRTAAKITAKTPTAPSITKPAPARSQAPVANTRGSPSRIPARVPLSNLKNGNNSPERARPESRVETGNLRQGAPILRAPPPKMRDLMPPPELETPVNYYRSAGLGSSIVRHVEPEDVYDDRQLSMENSRPSSREYQASQRQNERLAQTSYSQAPPPARQISNTSTVASTAASGSENWETYDDNSEPEMDASDTYYAKVRAARAGKRLTPETGYARPQGGQAKRQRGFPPAHAGHVMVDNEGNRIVSASEWTDEDAY